MNKIKYVLTSAAASVAFMLGLAAPAAAQVTCTVGAAGTNVCTDATNNTDNSDNSDNSDNRSYNCSVINPDQDNDADRAADGDGGSGGDGETGGDADGGDSLGGNGGTGGAGGNGGAGGSGDGGSVSQSNVINLTCNTNNVTNNSSSSSSQSGHVLAAQVSAAPKGGVDAGAGGVASTGFQTFGLLGSLTTAAAGAVLRKRAL